MIFQFPKVDYWKKEDLLIEVTVEEDYKKMLPLFKSITLKNFKLVKVLLLLVLKLPLDLQCGCGFLSLSLLLLSSVPVLP